MEVSDIQSDTISGACKRAGIRTPQAGMVPLEAPTDGRLSVLATPSPARSVEMIDSRLAAHTVGA